MKRAMVTPSFLKDWQCGLVNRCGYAQNRNNTAGRKNTWSRVDALITALSHVGAGGEICYRQTVYDKARWGEMMGIVMVNRAPPLL